VIAHTFLVCADGYCYREHLLSDSLGVIYFAQCSFIDLLFRIVIVLPEQAGGARP
jgi:hypothetical protein